MSAPYRVLVTGSRYWSDQQLVVDALNAAFEARSRNPFVLVHGACPSGADRFAHNWAISATATCGVIEEAHPADWTAGKKAGPDRNRLMVELGADLCVAFPLPGSKGTWHTVRLAHAAGIPVTEVRP